MPEHAVTDSDIGKCFAVMSELRTHLQREQFVPLVRHMETEGYRLAYHETDGRVVAVAGYRIYTNLFLGKNLYVDDLVTSAKERSRGYGETLLAWLRDIARANDCATFHLDSGTQRDQAHRFYFREGMVISSYHFTQKLA